MCTHILTYFHDAHLERVAFYASSLHRSHRRVPGASEIIHVGLRGDPSLGSRDSLFKIHPWDSLISINF